MLPIRLSSTKSTWPAVAERVQRVEFAQNLLDGLGAWYAAVELDDVAELAVERAAAGKLHADMEVLVEFEQVPARHRRGGDVGLEANALVGAAAQAGAPVCDEGVEQPLGLAKYLEVGGSVGFGRRGDAGAADDHRLAVPVDQVDQHQRVGFLRHHPAGHDHVGPGKIRVGQFFSIAVDEPDVPMLRQHRRDGDEAERCPRVFRADDLAGRPVVPERVGGEAGKHEQDVAGIAQPRIVHVREDLGGCHPSSKYLQRG